MARIAWSPPALIFSGVTLRGFWLAHWFKTSAPAARAALFDELVAAGRLSARVQATYGIDRIKEAGAAAAAGERDGKILVVPNAA